MLGAGRTYDSLDIILDMEYLVSMIMVAEKDD